MLRENFPHLVHQNNLRTSNQTDRKLQLSLLTSGQGRCVGVDFVLEVTVPKQLIDVFLTVRRSRLDPMPESQSLAASQVGE